MSKARAEDVFYVGGIRNVDAFDGALVRDGRPITLHYRGIVEWGFRAADVLELLREAKTPRRTSPFVVQNDTAEVTLEMLLVAEDGTDYGERLVVCKATLKHSSTSCTAATAPWRAHAVLRNLARGHALVHGRTHLSAEDVGVVARVVVSSMPPQCGRVVWALVEKGEPLRLDLGSPLSYRRTMNRRRFVLSTLAGAFVTRYADAQQTRKRIGFLQPGEAPAAWMDAFRRGLREAGWVEQRNVVVEHRMAPTIADNAAIIAELVDLKVDVLVTWTTPAVIAATRATGTIPIVGISGNPVGLGVVASLARPGGNVTGIAILTDDLEVKNLELLKQAVPTAQRIAVLTNPENPIWASVLKRFNDAARALAVKILPLEARHPGDLDTAFASARMERADALLVVREALLGIHRARIAELALHARLPSIFGSPRNAEAGGLISYAANMADMLRRLAIYVDKILKGANPGDLPIEQPTKFELIINLKTAKALGLTIPPSLLLRADQVIA